MNWNDFLGPLGCDLLVKTDWKLVVQILTFLAVIGGWFKVNELSARRDLDNERRKLRVSYLVEMFEKLDKIGREGETKADWDSLDEAIAKIQIIGSKEQIDLLMKFAKALTENNADNSSFEQLVHSMRDTLRKELDIEKVEGPVYHIKRKKE
jgi:histidyl-tRNA synthetase